MRRRLLADSTANEYASVARSPCPVKNRSSNGRSASDYWAASISSNPNSADDACLAFRMLPLRDARHSRRNTIAAITVGRSAPASSPIGKIAPSKKRPSSAWPAGFGAFAMTVSPPPTTAP